MECAENSKTVAFPGPLYRVRPVQLLLLLTTDLCCYQINSIRRLPIGLIRAQRVGIRSLLPLGNSKS
jgi:ABC-type enterobactin transport system permease subunit